MRNKALAALPLAMILAPSATSVVAQSAEETRAATSRSCGFEIVALAEARPDPSVAGSRPVSCPCFDLTTLTALPGKAWDVCVQAAVVAQVATWFGRSTADGREGYNLLVSQRSRRSPEASCQLLHRFRTAGEMEQDYRRILNISDAQAAMCRQILIGWLETRGGCATSVRKPD